MKATASRRLPLLLLVALAFLSCQLPVAPQTGSIEVRNPYVPSRKVSSTLVAFPQNLLANLDHYVLRVLTTGGDPIASLPDQSLSAASPVFAVDRVAPGDYLLVLEAWSSSTDKTAESQQPITVTSGAVTSIDTMTLVPLATGDGSFNINVTIGSGWGALATSAKLSATLSQLTYTSGNLSGVPTVLSPTLFAFTPSAGSLGFATTSTLPAGNYLITLERASASLDAPAPIPVVGILVQVFAGQVSSILAAGIPDSWLDAAPASGPQNVALEITPEGDLYLAWDAPLNHTTTSYYQVGYAFKESDAVPQATLTLNSGSGDFVSPATLERTGGRLRVKLTSGTPPFDGTPDTQVALFVRSVAGLASPSTWSIITIDPTNQVRPRPIPALVFTDLKPGAHYELQKRAANASVLASFEVTARASDPNMAPVPQTFTFPGLVVSTGETLVMILHQADGSVVETPIAFDAINDTDSGISYDPTAPYYVYPAVMDPNGSPADTWILLEDTDYATLGAMALDPPPSVTLDDTEGLVINWTGTDLGSPHLTRTGWKLETDSSKNPEETILGTESTSYMAFGDWDPEVGKVTHYRVRSAYQSSFNGQLFKIFGPPSAWAGFDLQNPALTVESWTPGVPGTIAQVGDLSVSYRYTDFQTENDQPADVVIELKAWGGGAPMATSTLVNDPGSFVTVGGLTTWTPPASWTGVTFTAGQSYQLMVIAADGAENVAYVGIALKGEK